MINFIKKKWFTVKALKLSSDGFQTLPDVFGVPFDRFDYLMNQTTKILDDARKMSEVMEQVSMHCRSNAELLLVGTIIASVSKKIISSEEKIVKFEPGKVKVHVLEDSNDLLDAFGISNERYMEINNEIISAENVSLADSISRVSEKLHHPNELALAVCIMTRRSFSMSYIHQ